MHGIRVGLVSYTRDGERLVAVASKVSLSRKTLESIWEMSDSEVEEWIRETWRRQHFSPWEHSVYTWYAEGCSRICTHQLVRHRIASYTQQSMRYTEGVLREIALEAAGRLGRECPGSPKRAGPAAYECYARVLEEAAASLEGGELERLASRAYVFPPSIGGADRPGVARAYIHASAVYYQLLARGVPREDARFAIPNAVRTKIVVTMNARELATSFLPLRMCTRAQWEIRLVAWRLWGLLNRVHPRLFKWTGPRCVFLENVTRTRPMSLRGFLEGEAFTIPRCPELVPREGIPACLRYARESVENPGKEVMS